MELVTSILGVVLATICAVFVHIAAHDFGTSTPKCCRLILNFAANRLSASDRDRYREEWLSDLSERETILSQWVHALGCLYSSGGMRRAARRVTFQVTMAQANLGSFPVEFSTRTIRRWQQFVMWTENRWLLRIAAFSFVFYLHTKIFLAARRTLLPAALQRYLSAAQTISDFEIQVSLNYRNRSVDITKIAKTLFENPSLANKLWDMLKPYETGIKPQRR